MFNALLGAGRAIVTAEAGTTRDTLEAPLLRGGKQFSLTDTAGLRGATSAAESEGVQRALEAIKQTNAMGGVLLWVLDGKEILNHKLSAPQDLIDILNNPPDDGSDLESARLLVLFNKSDLLPQDATETHAQLKAAFASAFRVATPWASFLVSAKTGAGLEEVQEYLTQPAEPPPALSEQFAPTLTQWRQISALQQGGAGTSAGGGRRSRRADRRKLAPRQRCLCPASWWSRYGIGVRLSVLAILHWQIVFQVACAGLDSGLANAPLDTINLRLKL